MLRRLTLALPIALAPLAATAADSICIEAKDGFKWLRCVDMFGSANCEFLTNGDDILRCVAFDASDEPIAAVNAFAASSSAMFQDVKASDIKNVICD